MSKKKDSYKQTELQSKFVKARLKNPKKPSTDIMVDIGHPNTVISEKKVLSNMIQNEDPRLELWNKYIGYESLCIVASQGMNATKRYDNRDTPDHFTRIKASEFAAKICPQPILSSSENTSTNILFVLNQIKSVIGEVDL